jgi:uncharacterized protein YndB with AHSA1/START domain
MPTARVTRRLPASSAAVWRVAADPRRLPEWWPRVVRVEGVAAREFTEVMQTPRGRQVRADHKVTEQEQGRRRVWSQDIEGTPFEKVFASSVTELRVQPEGEAEATVTLELRQQLRGISRFGGFLARRAGRETLRAALDDLERVVAESVGA